MTTIPRSRANATPRLHVTRPTALRVTRSTADVVRGTVQLAMLAIAIGVVFASGWPMPVGPTLVLGIAILLWVLATFSKSPERE